jgi:hypothetical protein
MAAKISKKAAVAVALLAVLGLFTFLAVAPGVFANLNAAATTNATPNKLVAAIDRLCDWRTPANLSVGQTITITSTMGTFRVVGDASENGNASGTMTFTVTNALKAGYILTLTSGEIVINGTTYTITSGSAQTGPYAEVLVGQGQTSSGGVFLLSANAQGNFGGVLTAHTKLDFSSGSTEYIVVLAGNIAG